MSLLNHRPRKRLNYLTRMRFSLGRLLHLPLESKLSNICKRNSELVRLLDRLLHLPFWSSMYRSTTSSDTTPTVEMKRERVHSEGKRFFRLCYIHINLPKALSSLDIIYNKGSFPTRNKNTRSGVPKHLEGMFGQD